MFGVAWPEFLIIIAVAVVVIGPKDLPHALYTAGKFFRKFKKIAVSVQKSLDEVMQEGELDDIIREANKAGGNDLQSNIEKQTDIEVKDYKKDAAA